MARSLDIAIAGFLGLSLVIGFVWAHRNGTWSKFKGNAPMLGLMVLASGSIVVEFAVELAKGLGALP